MESEHHLVIPESQDGPLMITQVLITGGVVFAPVLMPGAVELDGDSQGWTAKIEKVRPDRVLPSELEALQSLRSEPPPERLFG